MRPETGEGKRQKKEHEEEHARMGEQGGQGDGVKMQEK